MSDAQSELVRFVFQSFHDVAINAHDFDAVRAHGFVFANPGARFFMAQSRAERGDKAGAMAGEAKAAAALNHTPLFTA